jgi:hypothetical protein
MWSFMSSVTCRLTYTAVSCRSRAALGVQAEQQARIERLGVNHLILRRGRRQWQVGRESSSQTKCFLHAWEQGGNMRESHPPGRADMAHAASPRFTRQEDQVVWLMGGKHPCCTWRKSLQFHDAVYWTFAVASKGEAGMVKQYLSEAAPRRAQLAARPKTPRFGMLRADDQLQWSSHVWKFATGASLHAQVTLPQKDMPISRFW